MPGRRAAVSLEDSPPAEVLAQACTPGMSCFGHVVVLPNGELAEAATAAVETAAGAAEVVEAAKELDQAASKPDEKVKPDEKAKSKPKEKAQEKATAKADEKPGRRRCIPLGAVKGPGQWKQYSEPGIWVVCRYKCGDAERDIPLKQGCYEDCLAEANIPFW